MNKRHTNLCLSYPPNRNSVLCIFSKTMPHQQLVPCETDVIHGPFGDTDPKRYIAWEPLFFKDSKSDKPRVNAISSFIASAVDPHINEEVFATSIRWLECAV